MERIRLRNTGNYKEVKTLAGRDYIPVYEIPPVTGTLQDDQYLVSIPTPSKEQQVELLNGQTTLEGAHKLDNVLNHLAMSVTGTAIELTRHARNPDKEFLARPYQSARFTNALGIIVNGYVYGYSNYSSIEYIENPDVTGSTNMYVPIDTTDRYIQYMSELDTRTADSHTVIIMAKQLLGYHLSETHFIESFYILLRDKINSLIQATNQ